MRAIAAMATPASDTVGQPRPAPITAPPNAAPIALPRLKAPIFIADARLGKASAETLLQRLLDKIDTLRAERDNLRALQPKERRVLGGRKW
jgi:hypothetical protein